MSVLRESIFRNLEVFVSVNKFLFPVNKIKNEKITQFFSDKNVFISFSGDCFLKNNSFFLKNFLTKYCNSFCSFSLEIENVFDFEKIKYSFFCDNFFLDVKNFIFPIEDSLRGKISACSFIKKKFSFQGDLFNCLADIDFNSGFGNLKSTIKTQNNFFKGFLDFKKIQIDGVLSDNIFSFFPGFKNIKSRFVYVFDGTTKDFSFSFFLDKCKYKEEFFKNIEFSLNNNGGLWKGKVFVKDDVFSLNLSINSSPFLKEYVDVSGSLSFKRLPLFLHKATGKILKDLKTNININFTKNKNDFSCFLNFSNLSFFYLNDFFSGEKFSIKLSLKKGLFFFDFKSSFLDAETKNVPWSVVKSFPSEEWEKEKFFVFDDFFNFSFFIDIKKSFFLFFPFLKNFSVSPFLLDGMGKNDAEGLNFSFKFSSLENILIKNIEIQPFVFDFSAVRKNKGETDFFIKNNNFILNKRSFGGNIKALFNKEKIINGTLFFSEQNSQGDNILFSIDKNSDFWFLSFNSSFCSGRICVNSKLLCVENFILKDKNDKIFFSFGGNFDLKERKFENIKMFCDNVNIDFLSLWLEKPVSGLCFCDINPEFFNLKINDFSFDKIFYGNVQTKIKQEGDFFSVLGDLFCEKNICSVSGKYFKNKKMDFKIVFNDFGLDKINFLISKVGFFSRGIVNGVFSLRGDFFSPKFFGRGQVVSGNFFFYDTGTYCQDISASILCSGDNKIRLDNLLAYDHNKSLLKGSGWFECPSLSKIHCNFACNFNNFELLNIKDNFNGILWGGGFFSGGINFSYVDEKLNMVCDLKANKTNFSFVAGGGKVSSDDYISVFETKKSFFQKKNSFWEKTNKIVLSGNLEVDEESFFSVQINRHMKVSGKGSGRINFTTNFKNLFDVNGDFSISSGFFVLSLFDVFTKTFYLKPGGKILFRGPFNSAMLNLVVETEIDSFVYKGLSQSVDVICSISGGVENLDFQYSVLSKLGEKIFISQGFNVKSFENIDGSQWQKFLYLFFYKTLDEDKRINSLIAVQMNSFFNDFLNKKMEDKNFKLTVDFSNFFDKNIWDKRLKYDFSYKITDRFFLFKSGFLNGLNSLFENVSLRYLFSPGFSGVVTFMPKKIEEDKPKGFFSGGFVFNKSFDI